MITRSLTRRLEQLEQLESNSEPGGRANDNQLKLCPQGVRSRRSNADDGAAIPERRSPPRATLPVLAAVAGHIPTCMQDKCESAYEKKSLSRRNTIVGYQQSEDTHWRQY
jgi:hypothetical protein